LIDIDGARIPLGERLGDLHYGFIGGVKAGARYGLRAMGPFDPAAGHLFDQAKLLIDPAATKIDGPFEWHPDLAAFGKDTAALVPKCVVVEALPVSRPLPYRPPGFIYEVQVKAFTKLHPAIPETQRGTVAALAHPAIIAHLKRLGVDTLELMPLAAWIDERHLAQAGLANAWGYNPITFAAPDPRLAPRGFDEIRETVAALHAEGIRVILDVVFNHTGESDLGGPTLSLRGLDNALYFRHAEGRLVNDTGCGNTLALDRAPVVALVMDAMRTWVNATGIDGFRYDLAPVMGRTGRGFEADAPLLAAIQQDPLLGGLIHIAEPWDIGPGGYQLGNFPASWHEWNDKYRDDVRRFWRGDAGSAGAFATRLAGSSDVFDRAHRRPSSGINFVSAHDGFTLRDAVSFARKDNHANGEGNRDGSGHEVAWVAPDPAQAARDLLASLFLSRGTPMLTAGDEFGRSQKGNNNAYAQDNGTTWLDWSRADDALITFAAGLAEFRRDHPVYFADRFLNGGDAEWFNADGKPMQEADWRAVSPAGLTLVLNGSGKRLALAFGRSPKKLRLPPAEDGWSWRPIDGTPAYRETKTGRSKAPSDETIDALARAAGIQPEWWEVNGTHHAVTIETKRSLLEAMNLPLATGNEARAGIAQFGAAKTDAPAPAACYLPESLLSGRRVFGLAAHLYALRDKRDSGIGDFETLRRFCEATKALGGAVAGINPLHHMFPGDRKRVSPYQPSDRRFVDPIYIDVSEFAPDSKPAAILRGQKHVNYEGVWKLKSAILEKAFARQAPSPEFEGFIKAGGKALQQHAAFESRSDPVRARYAMWLQWIADRQLAKAAGSGLEFGLYRDLAVGCAYEGGEVWARPDLFAASISIGAPPDPFSANGQIWNLPPFNPHALAAEDFAPYTDILRANMRHAGVLRIDHVLGLARQFWIPRGGSGADGAYVSFPLDHLIAATAAESRRARCTVIGEDLGTVPDGLRAKLAAANILSYRVLWFEQDEHRFYPPESYPRLSAACLSSHDLAPFKGWEASASDADRFKLERAVEKEGLWSGDLMAGAHALVAKSPSAVMLVQADDLTGETEPLNVPGTDEERPNWRRRLSADVDAIPALDAAADVVAAVKAARP
jgi:glycogen debranching enzyme